MAALDDTKTKTSCRNEVGHSKGDQVGVESDPKWRRNYLVAAAIIGILNALGATMVLFAWDSYHSQKAEYPDAEPWGNLTMRGISHISVNVDDIDKAVEFYHR